MIVQRLWKVTRVTKYFTKCSNQNWCKTLSVVLNKDEPKKANMCKVLGSRNWFFSARSQRRAGGNKAILKKLLISAVDSW